MYQRMTLPGKKFLRMNPIIVWMVVNHHAEAQPTYTVACSVFFNKKWKQGSISTTLKISTIHSFDKEIDTENSDPTSYKGRDRYNEWILELANVYVGIPP